MSWVPASEEEGWLSGPAETRRLCAPQAPRVGWVESWRCKSSQHRKIVCLSPHVEKPLNSKRRIKVSYLNQFRVFGFLRIFMNISWTLCLFHISVSWVCYIFSIHHIGLLSWCFLWRGIFPATISITSAGHECQADHQKTKSRIVAYPDIRMCEIDIGNPKTRKILRLLSSGTKLFITFELKVIRYEERETHNLSMLTAFTSSALNPTNARRP